MSLIQLLKFRTWETRLFKIPLFETPRFQRRTRVTAASGLFKFYQSFSGYTYLYVCMRRNKRKLPGKEFAPRVQRQL